MDAPGLRLVSKISAVFGREISRVESKSTGVPPEVGWKRAEACAWMLRRAEANVTADECRVPCAGRLFIAGGDAPACASLRRAAEHRYPRNQRQEKLTIAGAQRWDAAPWRPAHCSDKGQTHGPQMVPCSVRTASHTQH